MHVEEQSSFTAVLLHIEPEVCRMIHVGKNMTLLNIEQHSQRFSSYWITRPKYLQD